MQEIEGVIDEPHFAFAVGRGLSLRKARQSGVVDATKLAVDVGGLHIEVRKRGDGARIFVSPVEPCPGQQLRTTGVDARGHAIAVQLYFMEPLRT
jgi:hypothetical protein